MKNKNKNKKLLLVIALLVITIGFALLSTNLSIMGISGIKKNTWSIHWDNDSITPTANSNVTPDIAAHTTDTKQEIVEFSVTLSLPGDNYEFLIDAVNDGTIDGKIDDIVLKLYAEDGTTPIPTIPSYLDYTITQADGSAIDPDQVIAANGGRVTYKVKIGIKSTETALPDEITVVPIAEVHTIQTTTQPTSNEVYAYFTDNKSYGDEGATLTDYTTDYTTLKDNEGYQRRAFLKLQLLDNVIKKASVCGILNNGTMICIDPESTEEGYTTQKNQLLGYYGQYNNNYYTGCGVADNTHTVSCYGSLYQILMTGHMGATDMYENQCNNDLRACPGFIDLLDISYQNNDTTSISETYVLQAPKTTSSCTVRVGNHTVKCR